VYRHTLAPVEGMFHAAAAGKQLAGRRLPV
jgi:hypothetical protein